MVEATGGLLSFRSVGGALQVMSTSQPFVPLQFKVPIAKTHFKPLDLFHNGWIRWIAGSRPFSLSKRTVLKPWPTLADCYDRLVQDLNTAVAQWLDAFRLDPAQASTLQDRWLAALSEFEEPYHAWTCDVFLDWGRVTLPDLIADFVDGEAEKLAEDHFYDLINELPRACQLMQLQRIKNFIRRLQALPPEEASRPHRPVRLGPVGGKTLHVTTESVTSHFRDHAGSMARWSSWSAMDWPSSWTSPTSTSDPRTAEWTPSLRLRAPFFRAPQTGGFPFLFGLLGCSASGWFAHFITWHGGGLWHGQPDASLWNLDQACAFVQEGMHSRYVDRNAMWNVQWSKVHWTARRLGGATLAQTSALFWMLIWPSAHLQQRAEAMLVWIDLLFAGLLRSFVSFDTRWLHVRGTPGYPFEARTPFYVDFGDHDHLQEAPFCEAAPHQPISFWGPLSEAHWCACS